MGYTASSACAPYPIVAIAHFTLTPCFSYPILALVLFIIAVVHAIVYLNTENGIEASHQTAARGTDAAHTAPTVWPQAVALALQLALLVLVLVVDTHTTFACVAALCTLIALAINLVSWGVPWLHT